MCCLKFQKFLKTWLRWLGEVVKWRGETKEMAVAGELHVVTGALGYSGRYIAERLLAAGHRVRTLTNSPGRANPLGARLELSPLAWNEPEALEAALRGAEVLYNTYWVRFNHRGFTFAEAVENSRKLFAAATRAGVKRVVHVSITNPSKDSPLEYFRGKAQVERALRETGLPHTILRPAVLFGGEDILINNIAWALRRVPVFGVFGDGSTNCSRSTWRILRNWRCGKARRRVAG